MNLLKNLLPEQFSGVVSQTLHPALQSKHEVPLMYLASIHVIQSVGESLLHFTQGEVQTTHSV